MTLFGKCILALEDEPIIALALEDLLLDAGADVRMTATVDQSLQKLASGMAFDAAVLDVNINGQTSYPVAATLTQLGIPFIFSTGYGDAMHPPEFAACPTVAKPYTLPELLRALSLAGVDAN